MHPAGIEPATSQLWVGCFYHSAMDAMVKLFYYNNYGHQLNSHFQQEIDLGLLAISVGQNAN